MTVDKTKALNKLISFLLAPDFYSSPFYEDYRAYNGNLIIEYIKKNIPFNDLGAGDLDYYLTLLKTILNDVHNPKTDIVGPITKLKLEICMQSMKVHERVMSLYLRLHNNYKKKLKRYKND